MSRMPRLFSRKWLRRLILILIGLLLAIIYNGGWSDDVIATPFVLGMVIGFLSERALDGYVNSAIVLISEIALILVHALAGDAGAGQKPILAKYLELTAVVFAHYSMLFVTWIPGVAIGLGIRYFISRDQAKETPK